MINLELIGYNFNLEKLKETIKNPDDADLSLKYQANHKINEISKNINNQELYFYSGKYNYLKEGDFNVDLLIYGTFDNPHIILSIYNDISTYNPKNKIEITTDIICLLDILNILEQATSKIILVDPINGDNLVYSKDHLNTDLIEQYTSNENIASFDTSLGDSSNIVNNQDNANQSSYEQSNFYNTSSPFISSKYSNSSSPYISRKPEKNKKDDTQENIVIQPVKTEVNNSNNKKKENEAIQSIKTESNKPNNKKKEDKAIEPKHSNSNTFQKYLWLFLIIILIISSLFFVYSKQEEKKSKTEYQDTMDKLRLLEALLNNDTNSNSDNGDSGSDSDTNNNGNSGS